MTPFSSLCNECVMGGAGSRVVKSLGCGARGPGSNPGDAESVGQ